MGIPHPSQSTTNPGAARRVILLLSAATLVFEINLTRLFSVAQFYHFAFLIVSMALLGYGASGAFLALRPGFTRRAEGATLSWLALSCGLSFLGSYLLVNWLPFDSFSIAWERRQAFLLALHYLALSTPFFFSGLVVAILLAADPGEAGRTYAANLLGSAAGCGMALAAPALVDGEGALLLSVALATLAALIGGKSRRVSIEKSTEDNLLKPHASSIKRIYQTLRGCASLGLLLICSSLLAFRLTGNAYPTWLALRVSPYKSLSYALQYPGAEVVYQRWNAFSRVDLVRSEGVRSLPGLSYRYLGAPPPEDGLLIDGDELSAVLHPGYSTTFFAYLPNAIAFRLHPDADTLILESRGGLDILTALALDARQVTAVEPNPLVIEAATQVYNRPKVKVVVETGRSYARRTTENFDVIVLSLANSYHPVRSGAYSLAEDYRYTLEALQDALARLSPGGLMVVTRWLQNPPSESLRAYALVVGAVESTGGEPQNQIIAFRGYQTATLLVKNGRFTALEIELFQAWADDLAFDPIIMPGMSAAQANRHNVMPEPLYYNAFTQLLDATEREAFYHQYDYEVRPPSDDRPFYGHYFKWSQASQVLAELGKTWQPFGGAGYFVVLALLLLASLLAAVIILLPVPLTRRLSAAGRQAPSTALTPRQAAPYLAYFGLIGLAFMLVEIPLIQRFILFLGQPAYALSAVLFTILAASGLGSQFSARLPLRRMLPALIVLLVGAPWWLPTLTNLALGLPLWGRLALTVVLLAPLGFLMGFALPGGMIWLATAPGRAALVPWAWAVNGAASVISAVLAALLALSFGFTTVLLSGAFCYLLAYLQIYRKP